MEGIVAKRTLKKSYYNDKRINNSNNEWYISQSIREKQKGEKSKENFFEKQKAKILYKISLQTITMACIMFFILAIKYFNISIVKESDIAEKIIKEYKTNHSFSQIKQGVRSACSEVYVLIKPIIPNDLQNKVKNVYVNLYSEEKEKEVETKQESDKLDSNEVKIYEETSNSVKEDSSKENIGSAVESEKIVATVSSSVSSELNIIEKIKKTNVKFVKPVSGVITSKFGAREVIFEGIDSYHTGTDIATNEGTKVVSSIKGKVTVATYNKYNGNYVEVENGDITTKYCHLSKISVKKGENIKAGEKLGEVGSTGLSTGPHLHFEIVYDGVKVDPQLVLDL